MELSLRPAEVSATCLFSFSAAHRAFKCLAMPRPVGPGGARSNTKKVTEESRVVVVTWGFMIYSFPLL